jgi:hypothetical protein
VRPVSQVMNPNCLFTHSAPCVKRQFPFITWETARPGGQALDRSSVGR